MPKGVCTKDIDERMSNPLYSSMTYVQKWAGGWYYYSEFSPEPNGEVVHAEGTCMSEAACFDAIWKWREEVLDASEAEA